MRPAAIPGSVTAADAQPGVDDVVGVRAHCAGADGAIEEALTCVQTPGNHWERLEGL